LKDNWNSIARYWKTVALYPSKRTDRDILSGCALRLRSASKHTEAQSAVDMSAITCLDILARALLITAEICEVISSGKNADLKGLFDGGESNIPNLYTRMKAMRDLCSAAVWSIQVRSNRSSSTNEEDILNVEKPDAGLWRGLVKQFANIPDARAADEVSALVDDTLEALLAVSRLLERPDTSGRWTEILRHLSHVRDHFDYAEEFLIATLHASSE